MTPSGDPTSYADDLARLDKATAKVAEARAGLKQAKAEAVAAVAAALRSCIAEGRNRTEVQQHSPFSPPTVRKIGEDAGIPPDERYVRWTGTPTAPGGAQPAATAPHNPPFLTASDRTAELVAVAERLPASRHVELVSWLERNHWAWLRSKRRRDHSDLDVVKLAIEDNLIGASDLR